MMGTANPSFAGTALIIENRAGTASLDFAIAPVIDPALLAEALANVYQMLLGNSWKNIIDQ